MAPPNPDLIGATVSHYRITGKLGEGGMGVVYRADDTKLERPVALKFLPPGSAPQTASNRFLQEARAAARVQHPNICPIFEISEHEGRLFFAMACIEGKTIAHLAEGAPVALDTALDLAIQIAAGLEAAHRQGVIHRDIKSSNIIVDCDGHACILDFGLALLRNTERVTTPGIAVGTPAYMSPEQAQGLPLDCRTDIWSLGIVLFQMLTARLPFQRDDHFSVLYAIVKEEPPAASTLRPDLPADLDSALRKALAKDPAQRWQSAAEMAAALRRIRGNGESATRTLTAFRPVEPPRSRFRKLALAGLAIALLAVAGTLGARRFWPTAAALPEEKQIAVLPLDIIGNQNDENLRALADGLVETLTAKLSQVEDFQGKLLVVPASEIRSQKITTIEAARRLYGANLAFTGTAQRWPDRIHFTQVLSDTATKRQLSANNLDLDANKPIQIRDRAVDEAVRMLALKLTPATAIAMKTGETATPGAYGSYLTGVGYLARYDVKGNADRAIASLEAAISQDPRYALAHAALGEAHWRKAKLTSNKEEADLARASIMEALKIDPRLSVAHVKLGEIYSESGQPSLAIAEEESALKIAPGNAEAYRALGAAYSALSRFSEAESAYRQGISHQRADWYGYLLLGFFYLQRGRLADARATFETAQKLTPDNEVVYTNLAALDMYEGKYQAAVNSYSKALHFEPGAKTYASLGIANYYLHRFPEAAQALNKSIGLDPGVYQTWGNLGTVYRHLPDGQEKARQCFLKALDLANRTLQVLEGDFRAHANMAEYEAKLGRGARAYAEIDRIPPSARSPYLDRIVLVYEFAGDRRRAIATVQSIPPNDPILNFLRNDPDLDALWRDIAAPSH
jgi:serine/threonine-protein kinase